MYVDVVLVSAVHTNHRIIAVSWHCHIVRSVVVEVATCLRARVAGASMRVQRPSAAPRAEQTGTPAYLISTSQISQHEQQTQTHTHTRDGHDSYVKVPQTRVD